MAAYATPGEPPDAPTIDSAPVPDLSSLDEAEPCVIEWLLSDHPWAKAERRRRRDCQTARDVASAEADGSRQDALRLEINDAEPDETYVARQRRWLEAIRRVNDSDYVFPPALLGPMASWWAPPGYPPHQDGFEFGGWNPRHYQADDR